ncbi:MAG: DUF4270 domain-containing protein [Chitinophagaceae bacterium]|nr:DUF4270 domain-containing protein [Chitinophagaceae bacterium]
MKFFFSRDLMCSFIGFSFLLLLISSCTRLDTASIGGNLIPDADLLSTDTLAIPVTTASFIENDTTVVDKTAQHVLGYINDPMFGTTTATMFFQMLPQSYPFSYPVTRDSLFLDSVVLSLDFNGTYGDTNAITTVNVYKMNDTSFRPDKRYNVNTGFKFNNSDFLGSKSFKPTDLRKGYKLQYKTDSVFNQLRIKLSNSFGLALLKENTSAGFLSNDSLFKIFLNGLVLVPDSITSGNCMNYFNLNGTNSRLNLYYRYTKPVTGGDSSLVSVFPFVANTTKSANANKIYRNYAGSAAQPVISSGSPSSLAYLLTAPGTSVSVKAPGLSSLVGKNYIVHRAELVIRQIYQGPLSLESTLTPPILHLFTIGPNGKNTGIPVDSLSYFFLQQISFDPVRNVLLVPVNDVATGGLPSFRLDAGGNKIVEYRMLLTRYVQNIINGKEKVRDFKLEAPYFANFSFSPYNLSGVAGGGPLNPVAFGRVQVGGGSHPLYPMYVRIYYSKQ